MRKTCIGCDSPLGEGALAEYGDLCLDCLKKQREKRIVEIIAWNLDQNRFDHETGETEMVEWIIDTYKRLEGYAPSSLPALLYANSLAEEAQALV